MINSILNAIKNGEDRVDCPILAVNKIGYTIPTQINELENRGKI
jgi:hypothetical protein